MVNRLVSQFGYGIVNDDFNHLKATIKDNNGEIIMCLDIPDFKTLTQVCSEEDVYSLLGKINRKFDDLYYKFPESMYNLIVSEDCYSDIAERVLRKIGKI